MFKNLDFQNDRQRSIFWVICFISWISFIATNIIGLIKLEVRSYTDPLEITSYNTIWGFLTYYIKNNYYESRYYPISLVNYFLLIIFLIILVLSLISFILFALKTSFQRDESVFDGFMGTYSKFHFIPLLCGTCLFLSGIIKDNVFKGWANIKYIKYIEGYLAKYVADLIFSFFGVISLALIKKTLKLDQTSYIVLIIKDGFFSILLALFTYSLFYSSAYVGYMNKYKNCMESGKYFICYEDNSGARDLLKIFGPIFAILVGLVNIGIAGYLKDIITSVTNAVIYFGFLFYFYSITGENKYKIDPPFSEGISDIILFICSIVEIVYLAIIKCKKPDPTSSISTPLTLGE